MKKQESVTIQPQPPSGTCASATAGAAASAAETLDTAARPESGTRLGISDVAEGTISSAAVTTLAAPLARAMYGSGLGMTADSSTARSSREKLDIRRCGYRVSNAWGIRKNNHQAAHGPIAARLSTKAPV